MAGLNSFDDINRQLDALQDELDRLEPLRDSLPHLTSIVNKEITRLRIERDALSNFTLSTSTTTESSFTPALSRCKSAPVATLFQPAPVASRMRIKVPVPTDKYPDYNFVGRLLGPRGATLKHLERSTKCKIMIRGKGSIRKDKEAEVKGKPGWEHVFNEQLHVVIEAESGDEARAQQAVNRAREAVELLLVPVPEDKDSLKKQQLRDLAILNGTFRGASGGPSTVGAIGSGLSRGNSSVSQTTQGFGSSLASSFDVGFEGRLPRSSKSVPRLPTDGFNLPTVSPDDVQQSTFSTAEDPAAFGANPEPPSYDTLDFKGAHAATVRWMDQPTPRGEEVGERRRGSVVATGGLGTGAQHYNGAFSTQT